jgi:5-formyltetrahydrofolate cyclo-ligase
MEGAVARSGDMELKQDIRMEVRQKLKSMSSEIRASASIQACALLENQSVWQDAGSIFFYAPLPEELDVWRLVQDSLAGKKVVCLPRFDLTEQKYSAHQIQDHRRDIVVGKFGIREPAAHCPPFPLNQLDLVLVPGVAFDLRGRRLGRGKGYYDRLLADASGLKCGVAFDEQIVAEIPVEPHDVSVNCILTPTRWLKF